MKKWLFTVFLLIVFPVLASHIVGGEFELLHISGNTYRLNLIIYFDEINGSPGAKDPNMNAAIYRKRDNVLMEFVFLQLNTEEPVGYTQPECSHGEIITSKLTYSGLVTLTGDRYNDPAGYYVSWQRCCRNYQITNIFSDNPNGTPNDPNAAGQTFYLEFPPVVKNGVPFYNSSPRLFPPLNDYGCPGRPYYVNFAGVDDDGDSLVYSLVTPLNTIGSAALPPPGPGPYPPVRYRLGFDLDHILNGAPDLSITSDGFLAATPLFQGLFVFAVEVVQWRNHVPIGESRRDFQMLVVEGCQPSFAPVIVGKKLADATFTYNNNMAVSFANTVPDSSRCIQVRISDIDSQNGASPNNFAENVSIRVIPLNFPKSININGILPGITTAVLHNGSTADFRICFPQCPFINGTYQIGIIAADDACSLPLTDTLRVAVTVQPPTNTSPYFTTATPVTAVLNEGDQHTWPFEIRDNDLNTLLVSVVTDGFVLANAGMTFNITTNQPGLVRGELHWDAYCNIYDFTQRTSYQVNIIVNDLDLCDMNAQVVGTYNLAVHLPGVSDPIIDTSLTPDLQETLVTEARLVGETLSFDITGQQAQGDFLLLENKTRGFSFSDYQISFTPVSGTGLVTSHFQWDIKCDNVDLKKKDNFEFAFVLIDSANKCRFIKTDTVFVDLAVFPPNNDRPDISIHSTNPALQDNQMTVYVGEPISLTVLGTDTDVAPRDTLRLQLVSATGVVEPVGYSFDPVPGLARVEAPFLWNPDCSIFEGVRDSAEFAFKFKVMDDRCFTALGDTLTFNLKIKDIESSPHPFNPSNIITPNGDGCNDYFAFEGIEPGSVDCGGSVDADEVISFPKDNCQGRFQLIRIHNRWGKLVFESTDRKFRWYARDEAAGVYYYFLEFSNKEYKGVLSVRP